MVEQHCGLSLSLSSSPHSSPHTHIYSPYKLCWEPSTGLHVRPSFDLALHWLVCCFGRKDSSAVRRPVGSSHDSNPPVQFPGTSIHCPSS